jgi:hypothetical protein
VLDSPGAGLDATRLRAIVTRIEAEEDGDPGYQEKEQYCISVLPIELRKVVQGCARLRKVAQPCTSDR